MSDKITELLKSPVFWMGTVISGLLINIASHYFTKYSDKILAKHSKKWANRNETLRQEHEREIKRLINNQSEKFTSLGRAIFFLTGCLFCIGIGTMLLVWNIVTTEHYQLYLATTKDVPKKSFFDVSIVSYVLWSMLFFQSIRYFIQGSNAIVTMIQARHEELKLQLTETKHPSPVNYPEQDSNK